MEQDLARIEQFLDALWLERNLAENTLSAYRRDLTMVVEWLHHRGLSLASVSGEDLQSLLAERQTGGYKATSTARLLSAVRRFFQHLYREKIRPDDPSALLASPKLPQRLPKDLSEAQVERLPVLRWLNSRWSCAIKRCWKCCTPPVCAFPSWWA